MGNGGSKKDDVITDHDRAVLDLRNARDTLKQQQKKLNAVMEREKEVARLLLKKGDKKGALWVLKKKKLQESMLEKTHVQLDNVEQMINSIDMAQTNARVLESLQKGGKQKRKAFSFFLANLHQRSGCFEESQQHHECGRCGEFVAREC